MLDGDCTAEDELELVTEGDVGGTPGEAVERFEKVGVDPVRDEAEPRGVLGPLGVIFTAVGAGILTVMLGGVPGSEIESTGRSLEFS